MRPGRISDSALLFRHVIFPIAYKNKRFAYERFIKIYEEHDGTLLASLAWERYLPTIRHVHDYGLRLAEFMNDAERAKGRYKENSRRIYSGAYQLSARNIRALGAIDGQLAALIAFVDVLHHIENGEIAHTDLIIRLQPDLPDIEGAKTAIVDRLWNLCFGPLRHEMVDGSDITLHSGQQLPTGPSGAYNDKRSLFARYLALIRFKIYVVIFKFRNQL